MSGIGLTELFVLIVFLLLILIVYLLTKKLKKSGSHSSITEETLRALGTKWLTFWTYMLGIGGPIGFLSLLGKAGEKGYLTLIVFILGAVQCTFQIVVAYGLSKRRLWAWRINWIIIFLAYIFLSFTSSGKPLQVELVVTFLIVFGLAWLWPNYLYWKKRLVLFK